MKLYIVILTFILFASCKTIEFNSVLGKYQTKGGLAWGSSIVLNKDSTFIYKEQLGGVFGEICGTWNIDRNKIVLNSFLQPEQDTTKEFYIIKTYNDDSNIITFDLTDSMGAIPGANGFMFQNGKTIEKKFSDIDGRLIFQNHKLDSIKISFIGLKDVILKSNFNNYYKIRMVEAFNFRYEVFTNETLKIRGTNLIYRINNNYYYEKKYHKGE